jgi:hypothetical protein
MIRVFLFIILVFSFSCKTKTPLFEIFQEVNFTIPAGKDPISTHHFLIHDIPSFLNQHLTEKQISLSSIDQLYAGRGKILSIYSNANFGIISKISVWIYKKEDYENRVEIYYRDEVPLNLNGEIKLLSTGEDVREILKDDSYEMDVEIQFKNFVSQPIDCRFTYSFAAYQE